MDNGADASAKAANVANTDVDEFPNCTADTPVSSRRRKKKLVDIYFKQPMKSLLHFYCTQVSNTHYSQQLSANHSAILKAHL